VDYADRYAGALLGGACGDALGRPAEGRSPSETQRRHGELRDFVPWRGWTSGPKGTITDDTQLTMCVAESIVARGGLDPEDLARRFVRWLPHGRGKGRATVEAVERLTAGIPWWQAGVPSAGNGAAMRAAPIGLLHALDPDGIRRDGALSAVVTHADPMAAAGAVAQAFGVAYCLHQTASEFDADDFTRALAAALEGVPDPGHPERRGAGPAKVRLIDQLHLAASLRRRPPQEAFDRLHNGAFVLESLPAAVYCFLASPADPERVIVTAANGGFDADTVAAMAGNLAGALDGASALPTRWLEDLEYRKELGALAKELLMLGGLTA
jgi:ADP-ribosylglycohydrolase